jgi:hypothetical protein
MQRGRRTKIVSKMLSQIASLRSIGRRVCSKSIYTCREVEEHKEATIALEGSQRSLKKIVKSLKLKLFFVIVIEHNVQVLFGVSIMNSCVKY